MAPSGRPGSKFSPGRDRAGMTFIPAGTGTGIEMKTRPGPGLASSRPGPGFFQYFSISVKMKQCYMLNKIFQNKLRYVKLKLTVSSSQGRIQGGGSDGGGRTQPPLGKFDAPQGYQNNDFHLKIRAVFSLISSEKCHMTIFARPPATAMKFYYRRATADLFSSSHKIQITSFHCHQRGRRGHLFDIRRNPTSQIAPPRDKCC